MRAAKLKPQKYKNWILFQVAVHWNVKLLSEYFRARQLIFLV